MCIWLRYDFDLWPLTLKTFSAIPIRMMKIFSSLVWSLKSMEIPSLSKRTKRNWLGVVNGRTDGQPHVIPENILSPPRVLQWRRPNKMHCWNRFDEPRYCCIAESRIIIRQVAPQIDSAVKHCHPYTCEWPSPVWWRLSLAVDAGACCGLQRERGRDEGAEGESGKQTRT